MTETANLAERFFERLGAGDIDGVLALTAPDFTWTIIGRPGRSALAGAYDRDRFLEVLGRIGAAFAAPPANEVTSMTVTAERILVEAHVTGRTLAGADYANDLAYVFDLAAGEIVAVREYLDTLAAEEVFGGDPRAA